MKETIQHIPEYDPDTHYLSEIYRTEDDNSIHIYYETILKDQPSIFDVYDAVSSLLNK